MTPSDVAAQQWKNIIALLNAEIGVGGRLNGIKYVGNSFSMWTNAVPALGVQLKEFNEEIYATTRHKVTTTFWIVLAVQSTPATIAVNQPGTNAQPNLDDAMIELQKYISDPTGTNGLSPVLRDIKNRGLPNGSVPSAMRTQIKSISYEWDIGQGEQPQVWAYAHLIYIAEQIVGIV